MIEKLGSMCHICRNLFPPDVLRGKTCPDCLKQQEGPSRGDFYCDVCKVCRLLEYKVEGHYICIDCYNKGLVTQKGDFIPHSVMCEFMEESFGYTLEPNVPSKTETTPFEVGDTLGITLIPSPRPDPEPTTCQDLGHWMEFKECASCAKKTGASLLCPSCLHNREVISKLSRLLVNHAPLPEPDGEIFMELVERLQYLLKDAYPEWLETFSMPLGMTPREAFKTPGGVAQIKTMLARLEEGIPL